MKTVMFAEVAYRVFGNHPYRASNLYVPTWRVGFGSNDHDGSIIARERCTEANAIYHRQAR